MPELLKNTYNQTSLHKLAVSIQSVCASFQPDRFLASTMDETWEDLELKARVRKISLNLGEYLPQNYREAVSILDKIVMNWSSGFFGIIFPDFIEVYGQANIDWDFSVGALERYTPYSSSEFAVRPFIVNDEKRMMDQMYIWSRHENEHVRRLASEGCRPQLPWGQALVRYKKDPSPILPILEQLKNDSSLYVRKSVANNLNDISKTHPDLVTKLAREWYGSSEYTDWIVKHGCRTLLKKGNPDVLAIFGYQDTKNIVVNGFDLSSVSVLSGDDITFSFSICAEETTKVRLEYGIDYVKANGKRNRKIFQISETILNKNEEKIYTKKHSFAELSTRKHYPGTHSIALIVNGSERVKKEFELVV